MASEQYLLLLPRTPVQFPALTQRLAGTCDSSSRRMDTFWSALPPRLPSFHLPLAYAVFPSYALPLKRPMRGGLGVNISTQANTHKHKK